MKSHVYILRDVRYPRFKIGKANDIVSRARRFHLESIDFLNSLGLAVESEDDAFALERVLQRVFRHASLDANEVVASGGEVDGASEWFDIGCWPRLVRYLEENRDLHPHVAITGESLADLVKCLSISRDDAAARAVRRKEKEAQRVERQEIRRAFRRDQVVELERKLCLVRHQLIVELERHRKDRNIVGVCSGEHGSWLILASEEEPLAGEMLWRLGIADTQFSYHYGGGSIISCCQQSVISEGAICAVSVPWIDAPEDGLGEIGRAIQRIFLREISWLKQLPQLPGAWVDAIFPSWFMLSQEINSEGEAAAAYVMNIRREANLIPALSPLV